MAGTVVVYKGASLRGTFVVTDDADQPVPLPGYSARMQVRARPGADVQLDLSTATGDIEVEPAGQAGIVTFHATGAATKIMEASAPLLFDCLAWDPTTPDDPIVVADGGIDLRETVTEMPV